MRGWLSWVIQGTPQPKMRLRLLNRLPMARWQSQIHQYPAIEFVTSYFRALSFILMAHISRTLLGPNSLTTNLDRTLCSVKALTLMTILETIARGNASLTTSHHDRLRGRLWLYLAQDSTRVSNIGRICARWFPQAYRSEFEIQSELARSASLRLLENPSHPTGADLYQSVKRAHFKIIFYFIKLESIKIHDCVKASEFKSSSSPNVSMFLSIKN